MGVSEEHTFVWTCDLCGFTQKKTQITSIRSAPDLWTSRTIYPGEYSVRHQDICPMCSREAEPSA